MSLVDKNVVIGCDPEFFFAKKGKIIGAEKVLPEDGLKYVPSWGESKSKIIIDGVQAELNPRPNSCRASLADEISQCFKTVSKNFKGRIWRYYQERY